jgi:hypothetical protein
MDKTTLVFVIVAVIVMVLSIVMLWSPVFGQIGTGPTMKNDPEMTFVSVDELHEDEVGQWLRSEGYDLMRYEVSSDGTIIVEFSPCH